MTIAPAGCGASGELSSLGLGSDDPRRSAVGTYDAALVEPNDATKTPRHWCKSVQR